MLLENMTLKKMIEYEPNDEEMSSLPLEAIVYMKTSIVSMSKESNYDFIHFLVKDNEFTSLINDPSSFIFFDFDGSNTKQGKFITIFEMTSRVPFEEIKNYFQERMEKYNHDAFIIIDFFTHNSKKYRLSDFDGTIKLDELINEK